MGGCVSLSLNTTRDYGGALSAHVISLNGDLLELPVPVTVSEVLQQQLAGIKPEPCFMCNSDRLNFDEYISPLKPEYELQAGQIYFTLPESKLHHKLSASDMAALAVKASLAVEKTLATHSSVTESLTSCCSPRRKNKKARISPIILDIQHQEDDFSENDYIFKNVENRKDYGPGVTRSGSMGNMQRLSSKRAKLAVRSFRLKLSTIHEGSVLLSHSSFQEIN